MLVYQRVNFEYEKSSFFPKILMLFEVWSFSNFDGTVYVIYIIRNTIIYPGKWCWCICTRFCSTSMCIWMGLGKQIRTKPPWMATGDRLVSLVMFVGLWAPLHSGNLTYWTWHLYNLPNLKMVILHSYLSLPEGNYSYIISPITT